MSLLQVKQAARTLSLNQLRKLDEWLHGLIRSFEESERAKNPSKGKQLVKEQRLDNKTYRLEGTRCGKDKCKCARGELHGPYWYSYSRLKDKISSQYIGKKLPRDVERKMQKRK